LKLKLRRLALSPWISVVPPFLRGFIFTAEAQEITE